MRVRVCSCVCASMHARPRARALTSIDAIAAYTKDIKVMVARFASSISLPPLPIPPHTTTNEQDKGFHLSGAMQHVFVPQVSLCVS